jgi:hypothetical protein
MGRWLGEWNISMAVNPTKVENRAQMEPHPLIHYTKHSKYYGQLQLGQAINRAQMEPHPLIHYTKHSKYYGQLQLGQAIAITTCQIPPNCYGNFHPNG